MFKNSGMSHGTGGGDAFIDAMDICAGGTKRTKIQYFTHYLLCFVIKCVLLFCFVYLNEGVA